MSFDVKKVKLVVMVPHDYLEVVRDAMFSHGAGIIGNYTHCSTSMRGIGTFMPNDYAHPFVGEQNKMEYTEEDRLEAICDVSKVKEVLKAVKEVHPYEEAGIDLIPLLEEDFFR